MPYQTIILELLEQFPNTKRYLASNNSLLSTMTTMATELRNLHLQAIETIKQKDPTVSSLQIRSEALEIAVSTVQGILEQQEKLILEKI